MYEKLQCYSTKGYSFYTCVNSWIRIKHFASLDCGKISAKKHRKCMWAFQCLMNWIRHDSNTCLVSFFLFFFFLHGVMSRFHRFVLKTLENVIIKIWFFFCFPVIHLKVFRLPLWSLPFPSKTLIKIMVFS